MSLTRAKVSAVCALCHRVPRTEAVLQRCSQHVHTEVVAHTSAQDDGAQRHLCEAIQDTACVMAGNAAE